MGNQRIMIVEDDAGIMELLKVRLELAGYLTSHARDGMAAICQIANNPPDAVILDIGLPFRSGFEVLQSMRANKRTMDVPVLMLTARHESSDVQKAIASGAQDYLAKPFDDQKLLLRVERLIRARAKAAAAPSQTAVRI